MNNRRIGKLKKLMTMSKKIYLKNFGCQMNEHDSGRVKDLLLSKGYSIADRPEQADVLLFNTCSVRKNAEDRVFGLVASLKAIKEEHPDTIFGILGCMAEAQREDIFIKLPHVDFICGPADLDKVPEIIERIIKGARHLVYLEGNKSKNIPYFPNKRSTGKNAYVKIMEGCDNFCSYCVVPYVRGRERSRLPSDILGEIALLLDKDVNKITLLGQNVNSYGKGLRDGIDFPDLLRKIDKIARGRAEISFITSHPKDAGRDLFKTMAEFESLSKKLHLPLQSGSNKILKSMNRGYSIERYKRLVADFKRLVKSASLTTDLIVGFPGETKKDFNDTLKIVKMIKFDAAYIFKYSPRPFTAASKFKDNVPGAEKEKRHALLLEIQKNISLDRARP